MSGTGFTLSLELGERALVQETVGCAEAEVGAPASSSTSMVPLRVLAALPGVLMSCLHQEGVQALSYFQAVCSPSQMCSLLPNTALG